MTSTNSNSELRSDFLQEHWMLVCGVMDDLANHYGEARITVLADLTDESGRNFANSYGDCARGVAANRGAWSAHFSKRLLSAILLTSWPSAKQVNAALRDDHQDVRYVVLVIAGGGVQLRGIREAGGVQA